MPKANRPCRCSRFALSFALMILLGILCALPVSAIPVFGEIFNDRQPDGVAVRIRVWGDEFYSFVESLDGYTLVRQADGWICYAMRSADGRQLLSSGIRLDPAGAPRKLTAAGITPHLRLSPEAVADTVEREKTRIWGPEMKARLEKAGVYEAITTGNVKGITVLIDFSDQPATIPVSAFSDFLNRPGYNGYSNQGSVRDFFLDVSKGQLDYTNTIAPSYYRALKPKSYYDNVNGGKTLELAREALNWLDAQGFDFSQYDQDNDGKVDALNFYYAGAPAWGWSKGLWPHSGSGINLTLDGKYCNQYQISDIDDSLQIGTFCHENGHMLLGFPDLYDYGHESKGMGLYCLMSTSGGTRPTQPCAYMKVRAKWATCIPLTSPAAKLPITANSLTYYRYDHPTKKNEYYLVDCLHRSMSRYSGLPDQGLAIWHIDENGSNNNEQRMPSQHYKVTLVAADARWDLERGMNSGDSKDFYDAAGVRELSSLTNPSSAWWDKSDSGLCIHDVSATSTTMTFSFGDPGNLVLMPAAGLSAMGFESGDVTPTSKTFTLYNSGSVALGWSGSANVPWLTVSPAGGALAPGTNATLNVMINDNVRALPVGDASGAVTITNLSSNERLQRRVSLALGRKGLAAYWAMDDSTGTLASDLSGAGLNGTLRASARWTAGRHRGGITLTSSTNSCVDFPPLNLYRNTVTMSAWVKRNGKQASSAGILAWRGTNTTAGMFFGSNQNLRYRWNNTPNTYNYESGIFIPDGAWCFVAAVIEPDRATLYVYDGRELRSAVNRVAHDIEEFDNAGKIGWDTYDSTRVFKGDIDDVRVYNCALTPSEVRALATIGGRAENPQPAHGARGVESAVLRWLPAPGAVAHRVYLGTSAAAVAAAGPGSPEFRGAVNGPTFMAEGLGSGATWHWRVDEVNAAGEVATGLVWSFTTTAGGAPPAPLAHWKFDETSGTIVRDAMGRMNGVAAGGLVWDPAGRYEGAAQFNGSTACVDLPPLSASLSQMTMSTWIKLNGNPDDRDCVLALQSGAYAGLLNLRSGNELGYIWRASMTDFMSGLSLPAGKWCFVAVAVDSAKATLYTYDGVKWASATNTMLHMGVSYTNPGRIGHDISSSRNWFKGLIDDMRIYNRALSADEIAGAALSRTPPPAPATDPRPSHRAVKVASGAPLAWTAGKGARLHDLYFGPSYPPPFFGTFANVAFNPGILAGDYFWRVDEVNSGGVTRGETWRFTTKAGENAVGEYWALYE